jgi:hypothetical protein
MLLKDWFKQSDNVLETYVQQSDHYIVIKSQVKKSKFSNKPKVVFVFEFEKFDFSNCS